MSEVPCENCGHEFGSDEDALSSVSDGDTALYLCPSCGDWTAGPPPGGDGR